jgi:mannose-6-phosphate isomerase-like protein (cupin superfamily)
MSIARKESAKEIRVSDTMTAYEYPEMDKAIHGAVVKLTGRYPESGRVVNEKCTEIGFVIEGSGKLFLEGEEIDFKEGDQLLIRPGQRYYWEANTTMFMPCSPTWYPEQHKEVD